jgi:hypothetical protein
MDFSIFNTGELNSPYWWIWWVFSASPFNGTLICRILGREKQIKKRGQGGEEGRQERLGCLLSSRDWRSKIRRERRGDELNIRARLIEKVSEDDRARRLNDIANGGAASTDRQLDDVQTARPLELL